MKNATKPNTSTKHALPSNAMPVEPVPALTSENILLMFQLRRTLRVRYRVGMMHRASSRRIEWQPWQTGNIDYTQAAGIWSKRGEYLCVMMPSGPVYYDAKRMHQYEADYGHAIFARLGYGARLQIEIQEKA